MSREVAEVLRKALAKFGPNGEKWAQGFDSYCGDANKFCVVTSFNRIDCTGYSAEAAERVLGKLCGSPGDIGGWNDAPERTFADVKALFEKAIAQEENDSTTAKPLAPAAKEKH